MSEQTEKINDKELIKANKVSFVLVIGLVVIVGIWFLSGILYVTSM